MATVAAHQSDLQAAAAALEPAPSPPAARPLATLDPRLLMAARRGDSKALTDLLQLNDADDQQGRDTRQDNEGSGTQQPSAAAAASTTTSTSVAATPSTSPPHVIVEVDPRRPNGAVAAPLPPPPVVPVLDEDGVTIDTEWGSLLVDSEIVEQDVESPPAHDAALPARQPPAEAAGAPSGSFPTLAVPALDEDGVTTMEGDALLHVVAACGDDDKYLSCAKIIVRNKEKKGGAAAVRLVLEARNRKGDTPLHCAAGAGNANMVSCLIGLIANTADDDEARAGVKKAFLRMQNGVGETALHQAVRAANNKVSCIDQLVAMDPELACIPHHEEDAGASPLYLAISLGEVDIARHLYVNSQGNLSHSGPDGRNVLHAAVYHGQALPMILEWLKDMKPSSSASLLVSQLTSQRDKKQKGSTPLHLAASLEGWPNAWYLSRRFLQVQPTGESMARGLLDANKSTAYQADDEGSYPIHVAAATNSLGVVKLLLGRCPECATLRDGAGRTFLHVAAEKSCYRVVRYVVTGRIMPHQLQPTMILNAQDSNGDTALHGAVRAGNLAVFNCLLRNRRVRLDVVNQDGMTPLDLSWSMIPEGFYYELNPRAIVRTSLLVAGAPHGGGRPELFTEKHTTKRDVEKESKKHTEATQVMSVVTALIATVTFASAFTLPGGYRSADSGGHDAAAGTPVLAGSYAFDAFILADTLAFICSILATCTLVYAGVPAMDISLRNWYFNVSAFLLQSAARSLVAAFGLGIYLVVHHTASAIAACAIVFASSFYGNMAAWEMIRLATTVLARIRIRQYAAVLNYVGWIFPLVLLHFGSYVIIFGLPAIRTRVH